MVKKKIKNNKIQPIVNDIIFRELFGKLKNSDLTAILVSILLNIPYKNIVGKIEFDSRLLNKNNIKAKHGEKDIVFRVNVDNPLKICIEMNRYKNDKEIIERDFFFLADVFTTGLEETNPYNSILKTYQLRLNPYFVDHSSKYLIDDYFIMNKNGNILTNKIKIRNINVAKMSRMWYDKSYKSESDILPIIFWFSALLCETNEHKFKKLLDYSFIDKKLLNKIERIVLDMNRDLNGKFSTYHFDLLEDEKLYQEARYQKLLNKYNKSKERLLKKGISQGIEQNQKEIIINLYNNDASLDLIHRATGLSIEEIQEITQNNIKFK